MGTHPIFESDFDCLTVNSDWNTSPWVFRVTQNTSTALPAVSAPRPARSACFSWATEACARKVRIIDVVYNASNNELVRTKTLVKGAIVTIDSTPFRQWYEAHYAKARGRKKNAKL